MDDWMDGHTGSWLTALAERLQSGGGCMDRWEAPEYTIVWMCTWQGRCGFPTFFDAVKTVTSN